MADHRPMQITSTASICVLLDIRCLSHWLELTGTESHFSKYPAGTQTDPNYPAIPASNVANISQGCKDQKNGTLCTK